VVDPRNLTSFFNLALAIDAKIPLFFVHHRSKLALLKPIELRARERRWVRRSWKGFKVLSLGVGETALCLTFRGYVGWGPGLG